MHDKSFLLERIWQAIKKRPDPEPVKITPAKERSCRFEEALRHSDTDVLLSIMDEFKGYIAAGKIYSVYQAGVPTDYGMAVEQFYYLKGLRRLYREQPELFVKYAVSGTKVFSAAKKYSDSIIGMIEELFENAREKDIHAAIGYLGILSDHYELSINWNARHDWGRLCILFPPILIHALHTDADISGLLGNDGFCPLLSKGVAQNVEQLKILMPLLYAKQPLFYLKCISVLPNDLHIINQFMQPVKKLALELEAKDMHRALKAWAVYGGWNQPKEQVVESLVRSIPIIDKMVITQPNDLPDYMPGLLSRANRHSQTHLNEIAGIFYQLIHVLDIGTIKNRNYSLKLSVQQVQAANAWNMQIEEALLFRFRQLEGAPDEIASVYFNYCADRNRSESFLAEVLEQIEDMFFGILKTGNVNNASFFLKRFGAALRDWGDKEKLTPVQMNLLIKFLTELQQSCPESEFDKLAPRFGGHGRRDEHPDYEQAYKLVKSNNH